MDFEATWYTPQGGVGNGLITATGKPVSTSVIAVDPTIIPLGSTIQIKYPDGRTEIRYADDTGSAIHGHIVDVFCWSESEAVKNGRQRIKLRILALPKGGKH